MQMAKFRNSVDCSQFSSLDNLRLHEISSPDSCLQVGRLWKIPLPPLPVQGDSHFCAASFFTRQSEWYLGPDIAGVVWSALLSSSWSWRLAPKLDLLCYRIGFSSLQLLGSCWCCFWKSRADVACKTDLLYLNKQIFNRFILTRTLSVSLILVEN